MVGRLHHTRTRRIAAAYLAFIACLGTTSAGHAESGDSASDFSEGFAKYSVAPVEYEPVPGAVDLDRIDPPIEPEAPAPVASQSLGQGIASFYGRKFHGRRTASGEAFDMHGYTAAHRTLPFGSKVEVKNPRNGRTVVVRINDRGPFAKGRTIDLSRAAAEDLGIVSSGHASVELALLD